jgi:transmembrane sensor
MSNENLESLMRDVARAVQGDARRRQLLPEIQARLAKLDEQSRQSQRSYGTWRLSLLGAAACAAGIAFFLMRPVPLSYAVDGAGAGRAGGVGAIGERLVASDAGALSLRFSDGSQVTLPPRAQAHVDALEAHGATVALEGGIVDVSVVHRAKTRWSVRAGRYTIRVTGTKFTAGWDRKTDTLTVTMREGSVEVTGPGMKAPARVVGGQRLRANDVTADRPGDEPEVIVEDATLAAASAQPAAPVAQPANDEASPPEAAATAEPNEGKAQAPEPAKAVASPKREVDRKAPRGRHAAAPTLIAANDSGWRSLYRAGRYQEGLAEAQREGFEQDCARLAVEDVVRLGELARLAHDYNRAELAYRAALKRSRSQPAEALIGMGKIAFDQRHDYAAASRWFGSYVQRFPHGDYAQEAAGLLLESRLKAGDNAAARDAAAAYLSSFPNGPRAKQARGIVGH